jgi:5-methylcytosine-specific restriction endonuclease McrA
VGAVQAARPPQPQVNVGSLHRQAATRRAVELGVKPCKGCGEVLPLGQFPADRKSPHIGKARCWPCERARKREYYRRNPTPTREYVKAYVEVNREAVFARRQAWLEVNREWANRNQFIYKARRRARQTSADCGCVTLPALRLMAAALGGLCAYCESPFEHWDHAIPLSRGGLHCLDNLVPACAPCNLRKGSHTQDEYLARVGLLIS